MQVSWKQTHAVPHVQGSTSRSLVCRPKRRLIGIINGPNDSIAMAPNISLTSLLVFHFSLSYGLLFAVLRVYILAVTTAPL